MITRVTCPQCQQPEAVQRTCLACGYVYSTVPPLTMLLRLMIALPAGVIAMLTMLLVITLLSKYVVIPAMKFIVRL